MLVLLSEIGTRYFSSLVFGLADILTGRMCYIFKHMPCGSLERMDVTVWIFVASCTKLMEDQTNCKTQGLAMHQELLVMELRCASEPEGSLDAAVVYAVGSYCVALGTGLGREVSLTTIGDDATQKLFMGYWKLDNLDQQVVLVEELRGSTFIKDVVYYFTKVGNKCKYEVREWWGPGRGHPGNKIPNITMVSTVGLGIEMASKGLPVEVNMGAKGISKRTAERTMGLFQLGAVEVARQWMQEKTEGCYKGWNSVAYMKIKINFFFPPLM